MKTITTTILAAMAGGFLACSSTSTTDGGTTGAATSGGATGAATTGGAAGSTGAATTGGTTSATPTTGGTTGIATTAGTTGGFPAVPTIGSEIDRMGRPAINTALTAPLGFGIIGDGGMVTEPTAKDLYNSDSQPGDWTANWVRAFASSLAAYDGLDGVCGNQPASGLPDAGPLAYTTLGGVLTDDQLYLDTSVASCMVYLGVELEFLGALAPATDCGGRTPLENTIDTTYTLLITGSPTKPVTNGVTAKGGSNQAVLNTFPFLATPN